jgi:uncharacterized membrane protein
MENTAGLLYTFIQLKGVPMNQKIMMFTILIFAMGCNSYKSKVAAEEAFVMPASIDYQFVQQKVFQPFCIRCHSAAGGNAGDVNLETYESVIFNLPTVRMEALEKKSMPRKKDGGPLPDIQQEVLRLWIESGASREGKPEPAPSPTPEPMPTPDPGPTPTPPPEVLVQPTWDDISSKIITPKCIKCHSAGGHAEDIPLGDKTFVLDPQNDIVTVGQPEQSGIVIAITRTDKKQMPPVKTGLTLSPSEIEAIKTWIQNGAKD